MERDRAVEGVALFLTGVAIGAALALLFAPQSGQKTRRQIRRAAEGARDELEDIGEELVERGRELIERGRTMAGEKVQALGKRIREATA